MSHNMSNYEMAPNQRFLLRNAIWPQTLRVKGRYHIRLIDKPARSGSHEKNNKLVSSIIFILFRNWYSLIKCSKNNTIEIESSDSSCCKAIKVKKKEEKMKPDPDWISNSYGYDSPNPCCPSPKRRRSLRHCVTSVVATRFKNSTPTTRSASRKILEELKNNNSTSSYIVDSYDSSVACSQEVQDILIAIHKN